MTWRFQSLWAPFIPGESDEFETDDTDVLDDYRVVNSSPDVYFVLGSLDDEKWLWILFDKQTKKPTGIGMYTKET